VRSEALRLLAQAQTDGLAQYYRMYSRAGPGPWQPRDFSPPYVLVIDDAERPEGSDDWSESFRGSFIPRLVDPSAENALLAHRLCDN
jgi:hypothetical protein